MRAGAHVSRPRALVLSGVALSAALACGGGDGGGSPAAPTSPSVPSTPSGPAPTPLRAIALNDTVRGELRTAAQVDTFRFAANAPLRIYLGVGQFTGIP